MGWALSFFLLLTGIQAFGDSGSPDDLDSLLNSVDNALSGKVTEEKSEPTALRHHRKSPAKSEELFAKPVIPKTETPPEPPSPALKEILGLATLQSTQAGPIAKSTLGVAVGVQNVLSGLQLTKEDDLFALKEATLLRGLVLDFSPSWPVLTLFNSVELSAVLSFSAGFFDGDLQMDRSGIINEIANYHYYIFPVSLIASARFFREPFAFDLGYSFGWTFASQRGLGQTDTVTALIQNDELLASFTWAATKAIHPFLQARLGSFDLFERGSGYAANSLLLGAKLSFSENL